MPKEKVLKQFGASIRSTLASTILISNTFVWYSLGFGLLKEVFEHLSASSALLVQIVHFAGLVLSAIAGAKLIDKTNRRSGFITIWMVFGIVSTLSIICIDFGNILNVLLISSLFGVSFGLGSAVSMAYFADYTVVENRAKIGGLTMLMSGLGVILLSLATAAVSDTILQLFVLAVWRGSGLAIFLMAKTPEGSLEKQKRISYKSILTQRPLMLYLIPWLMFWLVNHLSLPIQRVALAEALGPNVPSEVLTEQLNVFEAIEGALAGVFSVVGGLLSDRIGRKPVTISGFILLGLGYAALGVFFSNSLTWFFYAITDGIAWGIFSTIFITTVWGDLSRGTLADKYYAVGILPFFMSNLLRLLGDSYLARTVPPQSLFSLVAFFLFSAVLPLMFAPETLPEKKIRERELKEYVKRAREIKEKYD
jgi:MFS family permease